MDHQSFIQSGDFSKDGYLNNAENMVSADIISQVEKSRFKRDDAILQKVEVIADATSKVEVATSRFQAGSSNPIKPKLFLSNKEEARSFPATEIKLEENVVTSSESNVRETTIPSTSNYSGGVTNMVYILCQVCRRE